MTKFETKSTTLLPRSEVSSDLDIDEYLKLVYDNRTRIRNLASMLLTVCGMLLSASFIVLFFLIEGEGPDISKINISLNYAVVIALVGSLTFSILAAYIGAPKAVATKGQILEMQNRIYQREYLYLKTSIAFLFAGIYLFLTTLTFLFLDELHIIPF